MTSNAVRHFCTSECRFELLLACRQAPLDAAINGARGVLHLMPLVFGALIVWIDQRTDHLGVRHHLMQQSQPLRFRCEGQKTDPGGVAPRPVEARDQTCFDRVAAEAEDNRDRRGHSFGRER